MKFRRLIEHCDHEGETWSWWLQVDGNEEELKRLESLISDLDYEFDEPFKLTDDYEDSDVVDLLVEYSQSNYFADHNKVEGVLKLPERIEDPEYLLYKGGIMDHFKAAE